MIFWPKWRARGPNPYSIDRVSDDQGVPDE